MKKRYVVLVVLCCLVLGFVAGTYLMSRAYRRQSAVLVDYITRVSGGTNNKISTLISAIDRMYVDSVDVDTLIEAALPLLLEKLDPHRLRRVM